MSPTGIRNRISTFVRTRIVHRLQSTPTLDNADHKAAHILHEHRGLLPRNGWTTLTFASHDAGLHTALQALFDSSKLFFDLPAEEKCKFKSSLGTEEGWHVVDGEKEFLTIRTWEGCPEALREAAAEVWSMAGGVLAELLAEIAKSLALEGEALTRFVGDCRVLGMKRTASMLRVFRYVGEEDNAVVAEPHEDLGLLSLVIGDKPGLEVWERRKGYWFPIEKKYVKNAQPAATVLVGKQLRFLTNGRYPAGGHQVRSYVTSKPAPPSAPRPPSPPSSASSAPLSTSCSSSSSSSLSTIHSESARYRHSIVFVLRAHSPIIIDTDALTTRVTGKFRNPMRGLTAGWLFENIRSSCYNINAEKHVRDEQRDKLAEKRKG